MKRIKIIWIGLVPVLFCFGCVTKTVNVTTYVETLTIEVKGKILEEEKIYFVVRECDGGRIRQFPESRVRHIGPGLITVKNGSGLFDTPLDEGEWTESFSKARQMAERLKEKK